MPEPVRHMNVTTVDDMSGRMTKKEKKKKKKKTSKGANKRGRRR